MKSTNQIFHDFWQQINGLFTADQINTSSILQGDEPDQVWLIIEDDPNVRYMLGELVQFWGRKPITFEDGHKAMQWVEDFKQGRYKGPIPELTLSDVRLPGPQGHKVCGELRKIPELSEMPIIMHSAWHFTPEEEKQVMQTSQADRLVPVPLPKVNDFKAIIDEVIKTKKESVRAQ